MISIIIPVYNVEKYLEQCLNSVFKQTYKDIEVIIINDGSNDNSAEIIKNFKKIYSNIIYLEQENKGVSSARNLGLKYANGKYTIFLDPDDYLETQYLEEMYNKAENYNLDCVVTGYKKVYDDIEGKDTEILIKDINENSIYSGIEVANMMLSMNIYGFSWDKMFKTQFLKDENLKYEYGRYIEDWYPMFRLIHKSNKIGFINKGLYNYRQRSTSTIYKKNEKYLLDYSHAVFNIINYCERNLNDIDERCLEFFKIETFNSIITMYNNFGLHNDTRGKISRNLKELEYNDCNISLKNILKNKDINLKTKISLIMWKLKIRGFFVDIKKLYNNI